jgi:outer membrane receptor protein involved in Fe transport
MKFGAYFVLFLFIAGTSFGQEPEGKGKISGVVIDAGTQAPVEFATVALTLPGSEKPVNGAVADEKGRFVITKVPNGTYQLIVSFIGYKNFTVGNITVSDRKSNIETGSIKMSADNKELEAVTVEGQRSIVEEKVDRTVYNAENDATARGGDATDVLKRVPLLTVDMDGNVSLRGNSNIRVLINNKPSTITANSVADALKQIPADQIKTVEVITSPSAKYDAEGSAGIINIITKKNTLQGVTLNIDGSAGYRGSNLSLNGNYRKKNMGFSLGGFGRGSYNVNGKFSNNQTTYDALLNKSSTLQSADTRRNDLFGNLNFGWDWDMNDKNSLAASVRYGTRNGYNYQDNLVSQNFKNDVLLNSSLRQVETDDRGGNVDASLTYTHLFAKPQQEFSLLGQYSRNNRNNNFYNYILDETDRSIQERIRNDNLSYNEEVTLQADYQTPISTNQMLEFGGKAILRKVSSDYTSYQATGATDPYAPVPNSNLSNVFTYNQNIGASYLSYMYTSKSGYSFKAGTRYEYTSINANFANEKGPVTIPSYNVIVPSANVSKRLKNGSTLKVAYNRRIQRPSIQFLNPNIQFSNPYSISTGNPNLEPEYTNNYELSYSTSIKSTNLNFSSFVRNTDNAIQSIRGVIANNPADPDTLTTTYQNIGREDAYGGSVFANINLSSKLMLNMGSDVYYAVLNNNNPNPLYNASNSGWVANFRLFGSYTIKNGWGLQFFGFYRGPQVTLQGRQGNFYIYSLAVRKEFANKKGSIGVGAEQFLTPSLRIENTTKSATIDQKSVTELYNLNFKVTFSYRIGKMSFDSNRRRGRRSINNDDLKDDGGDNGGGQGGGMGAAAVPAGGARPTGAAPAAAAAGTRPATTAQTPPADPAAVVKAEGVWTYTIESPQGGGGTVTIRKEGDKYTGVIVSSRTNREAPLSSVTLNGNELTYTYDMTFGPNTTTIQVKSIVTGDDMAGTMTLGNFGSFPVKAKRNP